jgi:hypothetical protein
LETKALLLQLSLLVEPAMKPDVLFPKLEYGGSLMLCQACPSSFRIGEEGEDKDCRRR